MFQWHTAMPVAVLGVFFCWKQPNWIGHWIIWPNKMDNLANLITETVLFHWVTKRDGSFGPLHNSQVFCHQTIKKKMDPLAHCTRSKWSLTKLHLACCIKYHQQFYKAGLWKIINYWFLSVHENNNKCSSIDHALLTFLLASFFSPFYLDFSKSLQSQTQIWNINVFCFLLNKDTI